MHIHLTCTGPPGSGFHLGRKSDWNISIAVPNVRVCLSEYTREYICVPEQLCSRISFIRRYARNIIATIG